MSGISKYDDIIDTRAAQKAIDDLLPFKIEVNDQGDYDDEFATIEEAMAHLDALPLAERPGLTVTEYEDESEELRDLLALKDQVDEWASGATLIADSHFRDYAEEYAEEIHGEAVRNASWPFDHIDWDAAAEELQMDYTEVDFGGQTYWVR